MTCPYCTNIIYNHGKYNAFETDHCNEILDRGPHVVLTPTLGMFIEGHLLAVTVEHVPSIACLPETTLVNLSSYIKNIAAKLSTIFGSYCFFEHGVGLRDTRENKGQTIDHAHIHLIPINNQMNSKILSLLKWENLNSIQEIKKYVDEGYLLHAFNNNFYICPKPEIESQWIRKTVFDCLANSRKHWDWQKYAGDNEIVKTIGLMHDTLSKKGLDSIHTVSERILPNCRTENLNAVLIRHGEPDFSVIDRNQLPRFEKNFVGLKDGFIGQIYALGDKLKLSGASILISSPYARALYTAAIMNQVLLLPIRLEYGLREWMPDIGGYQVSLEEHLRRRQEYIKSLGIPHEENVRWESQKSVYDRAYSAITKYRALGKIIVVTHGIVISALTGKDPDKILFGDETNLLL